MATKAQITAGAHGTKVSDMGGGTFQALMQEADVSPYPAGGGARQEAEKPLEFVAFDAAPGGMMQVKPRGGDNPAPLLEPPTTATLPLPVEAAEEIQVPGTPAPAPRPVAPPPLVAHKKVTFITDMGDFDFQCYSISESDGWLTLLGPSFPKIKPDTTLQLNIDGRVRTCYAPGINVEIEVGSVKTRITHFLLADE